MGDGAQRSMTVPRRPADAAAADVSDLVRRKREEDNEIGGGNGVGTSEDLPDSNTAESVAR